MAWLLRLGRSMLGQVILLSALFVVGGVYVLAGRPLLNMPRLDRIDPPAATRSAVRTVMSDAVARGGDAAALSARIERNPVMQQVGERNPGFRYFALSGDTRVGTSAPRYLTRTGVAGMIAARRSASAPGMCARWERSFQHSGGVDQVGFLDCGTPHYYEVRGIAVPIEVVRTGAVRLYAVRAWSYARGFLLPAMGVLAICVGILLFHIVRIRRIARLASQEDDERARELSEYGMPTELLPLIRAINRMIADSIAGERRRRFFLSAAAHEMRTPLTILRTRLEMLDESEDRTKLIGDVRRLSRLVNDLLTLTRIGERPPVLVPTRLFASCRAAIDALDPVAMGRGVTLRLRGETRTVVLGDASLIETAAVNLIGNAIVVTPPGGTVAVSVSGTGELQVWDEGPGIAPDKVSEIFEPFVRLSDHHKGHGLGLAIVRAVADAHHATIDVDTTPRGTCFKIRFVAA